VPTPPDAPLTRTFSPGRTCAQSRTACSAVTPETGRDAACSNVIVAGLAQIMSRGARAYSAKPPPLTVRPHQPEDLVAHVDIGDLRADLGDRASDLSPSDRVPRSPQSGGKTDDVGDAARGDTVRVADAGRVHADQHVVITGRRRVDLPQFEDVRRAVLALDDRLHGPDRVSEVCRPGLSRRGRRGCKGALARGPAVRR
jgi:hypothetical protein